MFQSTLPWWERRRWDQDACAAKVVSIHAPVVGATTELSHLIKHYIGFNPRSRGGSDVGWAFMTQAQYNVSIHAPVVGATMATICLYGNLSVSIHAPVVGATIFF